MLKKLALLSISTISAFAMHYAEININDKDLEIGAKLDIGQFNPNVEPDTFFVGAKFLNPKPEHSDPHVDIDPLYELNFLLLKPIGDLGMKFGMGMKLNYTENFSSLPLGIEFQYKIPAEKLIPMYLYGSLYYAPEVLSFSDAADYLEYRIAYDIEVIENGKFTLGYRHIDTNYMPSSDVVYNSSWFVGFKIGF